MHTQIDLTQPRSLTFSLLFSLASRLQPINYLHTTKDRRGMKLKLASHPNHFLQNTKSPLTIVSIFSHRTRPSMIHNLRRNASQDFQRPHASVILLRHINAKCSTVPLSIMACSAPLDRLSRYDGTSTTLLD